MHSRSRLAKPVSSLSVVMLGLSLLTAAASADAQSVSHDGHRWYEIELLVFSQRPLPSGSEEAQPPLSLNLGYPARSTVLRSLSDTLRVTFPLQAVVSTPSGWADALSLPLPDVNDVDVDVDVDVNNSVYGPPQRSQDRVVRLPDLARDPFLLQSSLSSDFRRHLQRLQQSANYRPLFHGRWRQPLLSKSQATAIALSAGEPYGKHRELEGHVTLSLNGNRVHIDAHLWHLTFSQAMLPEGEGWDIPASPAFSEEDPVPLVKEPLVEEPLARERGSRRSRREREPATVEEKYYVSHLVLLEETRAMVSHALHYLDHPGLGVLVEVRPYTLPDAGTEP